MKASGKDIEGGVGVEEVLTYSFLKADYDFVAAQAAKENESSDHTRSERPLNDDEVLGAPGRTAGHFGGKSTRSKAAVPAVWPWSQPRLRFPSGILPRRLRCSWHTLVIPGSSSARQQTVQPSR